VPRARDFTIVVNRAGVFKRTTQYSLNYRLLRRNGCIAFPAYCCNRLQTIPLQTIITYTALVTHSTKGELLSVSLTRDILLKNSSPRSEEHTSELQSRVDLVCRLLLEKKRRYRCCIFLGRFTTYLSGPRGAGGNS